MDYPGDIDVATRELKAVSASKHLRCSPVTCVWSSHMPAGVNAGKPRAYARKKGAQTPTHARPERVRPETKGQGFDPFDLGNEDKVPEITQRVMDPDSKFASLSLIRVFENKFPVLDGAEDAGADAAFGKAVDGVTDSLVSRYSGAGLGELETGVSGFGDFVALPAAGHQDVIVQVRCQLALLHFFISVLGPFFLPRSKLTLLLQRCLHLPVCPSSPLTWRIPPLSSSPPLLQHITSVLHFSTGDTMCARLCCFQTRLSCFGERTLPAFERLLRA